MNDLIFNEILPYKSLFVTARPAAGVTTFVTDIASEFNRRGKRVKVFTPGDSLSNQFKDRLAIKDDKTERDIFGTYVVEYGNISIYDNNYCDDFSDYSRMKSIISEENVDLIIFEEPILLADPCISIISKKDIIKLALWLRSKNCTFIFTTHIKYKRNIFGKVASNSIKNSKYRSIKRYFDAVVQLNRNVSYYPNGEEEEENDEIIIYDNDTGNTKKINAEFIYERQRIDIR